MPQRFEPETYMEYDYSDGFSDDGYPKCRMIHHRDGQWVRYETFKDTTAQLQGQINKLKSQLRRQDDS